MSVVIPIDQPAATRGSPTSPATVDGRPSGSEQHPLPRTVPLWAVLVSVLPFLSIPFCHVVSQPETATGLFHYELPYYVANGRAAFERGNGVAYPNPFDPDPEAPAIYVHWLPEVLGAATAVLGGDPGTVILWLTLAAALALAGATQRLTAECLPDRFADSPLPLLAVMWGGGGLVIAGAVAGLTRGHTDLLQLDPGNGLWFLNWGRNALFPTEAMYHALAACCWLAEIRRRHLVGNLFLLLLATTHPWSGLELLLTVNLWRGTLLLAERQRTSAVQLVLSAMMLLLFLLYYRVWLPSFEQHAALQSVWELDWSLKWSSALPAWGMVGAAAVWRLWKNPSALRTPAVRFLLCALVVALGLSLHDRVIRPVQPLHFTRGYVWMPLCLLGAPLVAELVRSGWQRSVLTRAVICGLGFMLISDNLVFGVIHSRRQLQQQDGFHLTVHDRALFAELHHKYPQTVVLTESPKLNYLLPAYADHRPWLGHQFNTPDYPRRRQMMERCVPGDTVVPGEIPSEVMLLVVRRARDAQALVDSGVWLDCGIDNADWTVWLRTRDH